MKPRADSRAARGIWAAVGGEKGAACVIVGGGASLGFFCFFGKGGGGGVEVEKDGERGLSKKKKRRRRSMLFPRAWRFRQRFSRAPRVPRERGDGVMYLCLLMR